MIKSRKKGNKYKNTTENFATENDFSICKVTIRRKKKKTLIFLLTNSKK